MMLFVRFRLFVLAIVPVLFVTVNTLAQGGIVVVEGQQKNLAVVQHVGESFAWRIYNKSTLLPADLAVQTEVEYAIGTSQGVLPVLWKKQGDFYFTVTVFSASGCKNMKVGHVKVILPPVTAVAGKDTLLGICNTYILDGSQSQGDGLSYRWDMIDPGGVLSSNNSVRSSLSLSPTYAGSMPLSLRIVLTVTNRFGASGKDTVAITFGSAPKVGILYPTNPNKDGSMLIDGNASTGKGLKYQWSSSKGEIIGESNKPQVLIRGAGFYSLEVTDIFGCKSLKTFQYPFEPNDLIANADYVRTSWVDSIHIHVLNNDYDSRNDIDKRTLTIVQKPNYGTTRINSNGTVIYSPETKKALVDYFIYSICDSVNLCDTAKVTIDIFDGPVWIPEAISANGDGHNEYFVIRGLEDYQNSSLMIYTRSGQLIYKSMDYNNDWSGRALNSSLQDGTLLPTGTYYYVLHLGGTDRYIKGFVYLLY
ncbi:MAG: gliding motility-associated C-terminal domain-containing protein [Prolixibacteraceae bacterium]